MKRVKAYLIIIALFFVAISCMNEGLNMSESSLTQNAIDIAQTSGQLASGTSFAITGSSTESTNSVNNKQHGHGRKGHDKHHGILDGLSLLATTDELLAIIDAESASDIRGMRISKSGGATITHYNALGIVVTLPATDGGPQGCSFSGRQFPEFDSLLSSIVKTEINFGSGVTFKRDTVSITRSGNITINRTSDATTKTEVTTFENYAVNGIKIEGTKTRISSFNSTTGSGSSKTSVANGKITWTDGTVASWTSDKSRISEIAVDATTGKPLSGTITTAVNTALTAADGSVIYSHLTTFPLVENITCEGRRRGPVSGTLETIYRADQVIVDYGDGTCTNKTITITLNGVTSTRTIDG